MHTPAVLEPAKQVAADIFPANGWSLAAATFFTKSCPTCPPKSACPWPAVAAEPEEVTGNAGPQVVTVFFTALKSCVIFLCQWGWKGGHSRLAPKRTQACPVGSYLCFMLSQAAIPSCFLFSSAFWWALLRALGRPPCFLIYHQAVCCSGDFYLLCLHQATVVLSSTSRGTRHSNHTYFF